MSGDIGEIMGHKVDISKVSNRALRRVIRERAECNEFMFRYGDHDEYKEEHKEYDDHREKYKEYKEHKEYVDHIHTDNGKHEHTDSERGGGSSFNCYNCHKDYDPHEDHIDNKK